jgi:hypothetical protein
MKFAEIQSTSSTDYVKFDDGETKQGVLRGDPKTFFTHWVQGEQRSALCSGGPACELCKKGDKPKLRFRLNFVMNENGAYVAKLLEGNRKLYMSLKALHEADYDLEKTVLRITRNGKGTNTVYSVVPKANGALTPEAEKQIAAVRLHALDSTQESEGDFEPSNDPNDPPF